MLTSFNPSLESANENNKQYNMQWGVKEIHVLSVLASSKGLSELLKYHPDVHVTVGHIDDKINDDGDIVPGLGDAGKSALASFL